MANEPALDPILASVLQRRLEAITREMATRLMRSSRSPIFNEVGDLVTVLFDARGRTIAQTEFAAIIAFGARPALAHIIDYFGDDLADGDVILHNDVFTGGNQNADVGVYVPVFHSGELVAWVAAKGHLADIGGMTAGGYDPAAREVWQEAFRIPPVKLYDAGRLRRDVWDLVAANIRFDYVMQDVRSMLGVCEVGRSQFVAVLERYGADGVFAHIDYLKASAERQVRAELATWPDGVYTGESVVVSDGIDPASRTTIRCAVTVAGDEITFDFTATDDQTPGFVNMPPASANGAVRIAFLMLLAAGGLSVPTNEGLFAPVHTVFRPGSLLDPRFPAATIFGNQLADHVLEAIMAALAPALPQRVTAGWAKYVTTLVHGHDPRADAPFVMLTVFQRTGPGAMHGHDGWDALGFTGTAGQMRSADPEPFEILTPHFLEYHEYLTDSAGAGRWRGGLGTRSAWRCDGLATHGVTLGDGMACEGAPPPRGLAGGADGGLNRMELEFPDGTTRAWGSKERVQLPPGTVVRSWCAGGAGYGDPLERPADAVLADVRAGLLSTNRAHNDYGVVVTADWRLDARATDTLRAILRTAR